MSKRFVLTVMLVLAGGVFAPVFAQGTGGESSLNLEIAKWSIITAGFALGIAAGLAALGQGKAVSAAAEAISRNPGAAGDVRGALILGLVLIESLVIYVLLISFLLFFFKPFSG